LIKVIERFDGEFNKFLVGIPWVDRCSLLLIKFAICFNLLFINESDECGPPSKLNSRIQN
jgi:hypothetical protein